MSIVAVIPARGGSKGIPRKNLQKINGLPLVAWSIRAALASSVDAVYVSTEDREIAEVAVSHGAKVIVRPTALAEDEAHTLPVLQHAAESLGLVGDDVLVCMECTSPFHTAEDIDSIIKGVMSSSVDMAASVCIDHTYQLRPTPTGIKWLTYDRAAKEERRQDMPLTFKLGGGLSAFRTSYLMATTCSFSGDINPVQMPEERCVDIDTPLDLQMARAIANVMKDTGEPVEWIVVGSSPSAAEGLKLATAGARGLTAKTITTNRGEQLFSGDQAPDVYHLHDHAACEIHQAAARRFDVLGTTLSTLHRDSRRALEMRGVDWFDEFLKLSDSSQHPGTFKQGEYASCGLSGLMCLQYALNHEATDVHLVGMEGYGDSAHYFDGSEDCGHEKNKRFTETLIRPFVQSCIDACPDVTFHFYGKLNYEVSGENVRWIG